MSAAPRAILALLIAGMSGYTWLYGTSYPASALVRFAITGLLGGALMGSSRAALFVPLGAFAGAFLRAASEPDYPSSEPLSWIGFAFVVLTLYVAGAGSALAGAWASIAGLRFGRRLGRPSN